MRYLAAFLCVFLGVSNIVPAESVVMDWPHWRGPTGDGSSPVTGIRKNWSTGLKELWRVEDLCQGTVDPNDPAVAQGRASMACWSSPSIKGNKLVVPGRHGDHDTVTCLEADTGKLIWLKSYPAPGPTQYGSGARATPFIDKDRVYTFGRNGHLVCWALDTGDIIWKKHIEDEGGTPANFGFTSSPLVYQNLVIIIGGGEAMVIAYNKLTGNVAWKQKWADQGSGKPGYSSPSIARIGDVEYLIVFTAGVDGPSRNGHEPGKIAGLSPLTGQLLWQSPWWCDWDLFANVPIVHESMIIVSTGRRSGSKAVKINGTEVKDLWENWRNGILTPMQSDPIIVDGYIYGFSGDARAKGELQCVKLDTGQLIWKTKEAGNGTMIYIDDHLLCLTYTGKLLLVKPSSNGYQPITEFQTALTMDSYPQKSRYTWTPPVVAHDRLYVRYCNQLICYALKE